jgi:excinuclease ABC subunit C
MDTTKPDFLKGIPLLPGVYFFKNRAQKIIYIGKAKSLRTRVRSYFKKVDQDWKIQCLIREHDSVDFVLTKTEVEALLLEAQLIKQYQPKYNVLLKSGNPFLYILFTLGVTPEVKLVRNKQEKGTYFGPFLHKKEARSGYRFLIRTFQLQFCNKKIDGGCLDYHLGLCAGGCRGDFDEADYRGRVELAQEVLKGNYKKVSEQLTKQIQELSKRREFEKAKNLHSYLNNLEIIFQTLKARFTEVKYDAEVFVATTKPKKARHVAAGGLDELQKILNLPVRPKSIDCFDISHFQSRYLVGSCIRFTEGEPDASGFRRFKIKSLIEQNDYAALQEIVTRRYASTRKDPSLPDIVLIDGGKGQLSAVKAILPHALCISLAKKEERLYTPYHPEGLVLSMKTELGQLLVALRDYAHHFAISYHKLLRSKGVKGDED